MQERLGKPSVWQLLAMLLIALPAHAGEGSPPPQDQRAAMPAAVQAEPALSAAAIIARAHTAAGGDRFVRPGALFLSGYNIIYSPAGEVLWDQYAMWRVFAEAKDDAHAASGKVRIEAWSGEQLALLVSFDGSTSYNQDGAIDDPGAAALWSNNFGFGAIRNALDEGWTQLRKPDDLIDGETAYMIALTDPAGGETLFGIRMRDDAIVYVGFQTPRGWHERRYSHFFTKPGTTWVQPGRVRLSYNGVKANEAIWTDFALHDSFPDSLFVIKSAPPGPTW